MERLRLLVLCLVICQGLTDNTTDTVTSPTAAATSSDTHSDEDERVSYEGAQLWSVDALSMDIKEGILKLEDLGVLATWNGMEENSSAVDVFVSQENQVEVKKYLRDNNVTYKITIDNIQRAIDTENTFNTEVLQTNVQARFQGHHGSSGHPMTWNAYHSLDDMYAYMDYLVDSNAALETRTIGYSVEGRPIRAALVKYGLFDLDSIIFIDGGMHGREWASVSSAMYILKELAENSPRFGINDDFYNTLFVIVPCLNPDGYEYSRKTDRLWRKNRKKGSRQDRKENEEHHHHHHYHKEHKKKKRCDGVDLNRNFGYKWGGAGSSGNECKETYRGTAPFSEPESAAYKTFVEEVLELSGHGVAVASMSFHSYGQSITFPWSYDRKVHDSYQVLQGMGNEMALNIKNVAGKTYKVGAFAPLFYPASGTSTDWFMGEKGVNFAYTIELRDKGRYGFLLPAHEIIPAGEEALAALISFWE